MRAFEHRIVYNGSQVTSYDGSIARFVSTDSHGGMD